MDTSCQCHLYVTGGEGAWMGWFHLRFCWLCGCVRVVPWGGWMAGPRHIVEFMGPSSYTLMVALRWRIHEASSLIDSSVPFLPQPGQAEAYYCPNAWCSKQSDTCLCTHAQHFQMDSQFQIYIYKNTSVHLTKKKVVCWWLASFSHSLPSNFLSVETMHVIKLNLLVCLRMLVYVAVVLHFVSHHRPLASLTIVSTATATVTSSHRCWQNVASDNILCSFSNRVYGFRIKPEDERRL